MKNIIQSAIGDMIIGCFIITFHIIIGFLFTIIARNGFDLNHISVTVACFALPWLSFFYLVWINYRRM